LLAAFWLATDLGMRQPIDHVLRSWLIAWRLCKRAVARRGCRHNVEGYLAAEGQMMTVPEIPPEAQQQAEASVAGPAAEVLERLAEKLGSKASVSAVFGEPVARAGITIIPVARVGFGFGAGAGSGRKQAEVAQGGGGGGGASAAPVGYIEIKDGHAVFKPIRDPLVDVVVPLATLVAGFAAPRMVRRLLRRR